MSAFDRMLAIGSTCIEARGVNATVPMTTFNVIASKQRPRIGLARGEDALACQPR
jgi:hypothetical protein